MKKTLKSVIAATLALVMLLCSVPAFAYEAGDTVDWIILKHDYMDRYEYAGEIVVGKNTFSDCQYSVCCNINIEKAGYYLFSGDEMGEINISENIEEDGAPQGYGDVFYAYGNAEDEALVYLPEGESYIGFYAGNDTHDIEITVSCFDAQITDIEFEDNAFNDLIFWEDYWFSEVDDICIGMYRDAKITFSNGDVYEVYNGKFAFNYEKTAENEYKLSIILPNYTEEFTMTCCEPQDIVKSVEITNLEKYLSSTVHYDETANSVFENDTLRNEKMTFTFTDGSTYTIDGPENYDLVKFPNGRQYEMYIVDVVNGDSVKLAVNIADQYVAEFECETRKATLFENARVLADNIMSNFRFMKYYVNNFFGTLNSDEATDSEIIDSADTLMFVIKNESSKIADEIGDFTMYYLTGGLSK